MSRMQNQKIVETILDECCFIAGGRRSGKTNLGILIADSLLRNDVQIKVIDTSRQWIKRSSLPYSKSFFCKSKFKWSVFNLEFAQFVELYL